ncbi:MAG: biotin synthase BioB [Phycisphaerae bacterium]|nr:biotin synthase BioB [Phycisphaerae bacterium]
MEPRTIGNIQVADEAGEGSSREALLTLAGGWRENLWDLLSRAHRIRVSRFGRAVRLCSIVPGKLGGCRGDCRWCAQSSHVTAGGLEKVTRTPLAEIVSEARVAASVGAANIGIVNSGLRPSRRDLADVIHAAEEISKATQDRIGVCASLGELTVEQAQMLADSREIRRYHHNLETSRRFFPSMVSNHTYDAKLQTLQAAKSAGLAICCGGLFGLGETWEDRIDLALTLRDEIQPDVVPLNFLVPIPRTPLANQIPLQPLEILAIIAIFRLILPDADIKVAGGREKNLRDMQGWMFYAGATSCMIGNYLTTAGQSPEQDLQMIQSLDWEISTHLYKKT